MKRFAMAALVGLIPAVALSETLGEVSTVFNWIGPNHKIVIEAFDDPRVSGVSCHLSRPRTGGLSGAVGLAEDRSDASIACRQIGPIDVNMTDLKKRDGERVFTERTSMLFKSMQVVRFTDVKRNTIVYLVYSDKLIDGSPKNAITSVPVMPWHQ